MNETGGATRDAEAEVLAAHAAGATDRLVVLYAEAAERAAARGDMDAAAFLLTHAYVFALESGHPRAGALHARLAEMGRDE